MSIRVCVIDLPGLSRELLAHVPPTSSLGKWLANQPVSTLKPSWPAVTCSVQATLTTGVSPSQHGIIANGLPTFLSAVDQALVDSSNFENYRKKISFWEQSNQFVQAPRFWQDSNGQSKFKTALLFFKHCMPGFHGDKKPSADIVLTPKPDHGPDGKLTSLCWSNPPELVPTVFKELGPFPLMNYWGPMANIASSAWIAKAAAIIWRQYAPQLQLVYVPHLDYDLQRFGPSSPQAIKAVVDVSAALDPLIDQILADGAKLIVLSEYSIGSVNKSVAPNQLLKAAGLLKTKQTPDGALIDYENSDAFAMVDHQIAHVYLKPTADRAYRDEGTRIRWEHRHGHQARARRSTATASRARHMVRLSLVDRTRRSPDLRPHGRHSPQARLRPPRTVARTRHKIHHAGREHSSKAATVRCREAMGC